MAVVGGVISQTMKPFFYECLARMLVVFFSISIMFSLEATIAMVHQCYKRRPDNPVTPFSNFKAKINVIVKDSEIFFIQAAHFKE